MDEISLKDLESKYADDTDEEEATGEGSMPGKGSQRTSAAPADEADTVAQGHKDGLDISKGMETAGPEDGFCEEDEEYAEEEDSDEDVMAALEWADMRDGGLTPPHTPDGPPRIPVAHDPGVALKSNQTSTGLAIQTSITVIPFWACKHLRVESNSH